MTVRTLFDEERRQKIRNAVRKGEPLPKARAFPEPQTDVVTQLTERDQEFIPQPHSKAHVPRVTQTELAQYRLDQDLIRAVGKKDRRGAEAALAKGASVNARDFPDNATIMLSSGMSRDEYECSVTQTQGDTVLMIAAQHGDLEMVKFLHSKGADLDMRVNYGAYPSPTALTYAQRGHFEELSAYLTKHGAKL